MKKILNTKYLVPRLVGIPILILFVICNLTFVIFPPLAGWAVQIGGGTTDHPEKISGSLEVTSGITFNGIYYNWPALQGGTSTYLQNDGTGSLSWSALGGVLVSMEVIAAGTTSYTPTAGISSIVVECVAGGGGGGGVSAVTPLPAPANCSSAAGGGGGSYGRKFISSPAASYTVSVGTGGGGGGGGPGGSGPGSDGNSTTFGSPAIITCAGGYGGAAGGTTGSTALFTAGGGGGVIAAGGGDINIGGQAGSPGFRQSGTIAASGNGGSSFFGGGAVGLTTATGPGNTAASYGAGGSGACNTGDSVGGYQGGAGSDGVMVIWEFK